EESIEGLAVLADRGVDALDLGLDDLVVLLQVFLEARASVLDPLGCFALDPLDLGRRPLLDMRDVLFGETAELLGLDRGTRSDFLDVSGGVFGDDTGDAVALARGRFAHRRG